MKFEQKYNAFLATNQIFWYFMHMSVQLIIPIGFFEMPLVVSIGASFWVGPNKLCFEPTRDTRKYSIKNILSDKVQL